MFASEQDRVSQYRNLVAEGNGRAKKLWWDPVAKKIRPMGYHEPPAGGLVITPPDMEHSGV